jgi:TRAP-type C4-dicarboxylate transport system permease small subunit
MQRWLDGCERVLTLVATTNYLMVAVIFLAMPYAYRQGANIRVTFLVDRLGRTPRLVVNHAVQVTSILYCAALVFATFQQARHVLTTNTTFATLDLPCGPRSTCPSS